MTPHEYLMLFVSFITVVGVSKLFFYVKLLFLPPMPPTPQQIKDQEEIKKLTQDVTNAEIDYKTARQRFNDSSAAGSSPGQMPGSPNKE